MNPERPTLENPDKIPVEDFLEKIKRKEEIPVFEIATETAIESEKGEDDE